MRALIVLILLSLSWHVCHAANDAPTPPPPPPDEFDQGLFEDALPQAAAPKPKSGERLVDLDATVKLHYLFSAPSSDNFTVTYRIRLSGVIVSKTALIRGNATIKTEIKGYLAKWTSGQCLLQVNVAGVPYEMTVTEDGDTSIKLGLQFKQKILEDWQSLCTFIDAPDSRFYTKGEPEKWISDALQKAKPSLDNILVPISETEKTSTKFTINRYSVKDSSVGSAEVDGSGTITIEPPPAPPSDQPKNP